jgi:hypothetical protein
MDYFMMYIVLYCKPIGAENRKYRFVGLFFYSQQRKPAPGYRRNREIAARNNTMIPRNHPTAPGNNRFRP